MTPSPCPLTRTAAPPTPDPMPWPMPGHGAALHARQQGWCGVGMQCVPVHAWIRAAISGLLPSLLQQNGVPSERAMVTALHPTPPLRRKGALATVHCSPHATCKVCGLPPQFAQWLQPQSLNQSGTSRANNAAWGGGGNPSDASAWLPSLVSAAPWIHQPFHGYHLALEQGTIPLPTIPGTLTPKISELIGLPTWRVSCW